MPEFFPRMDIGQMHLNERNGHAQKGIPQRDARMGKGPGLITIKSTSSNFA